ncbi:recombinase family protein [Mycobacteroides abscessus subsp. abscessus]|uniref:recombinase family protein n=1 Tax=Mycobacteroides abscessus TaxID=36809 RepID=UPI00092A2B46|nr:recombinase family protein [Mycobacteroides abscessus]MDO3087210.1 recombinase family protein [Mycobacteroides abscessus subsp. abscessus]MDO3269200.1 recombinase family protein [Mycobacteroides abscessus subsp. abscessus]SHP99250.1 resolvase domain-containing protein [Mycobacteroides abscessus subsp. abscessus]SHY42175.1 resolvase domain-containing protein [Mycobacteroides abscessus subsp. abscessus]SHY57424.1 resolvase domain-containing protein [Mycobacteroides abscessus subsp. abscessus]
MTTHPRRLVAYLRVSTIEQAEHGYGLSAQRTAIRAATKSAGHRIVAWHADEGVSGARGPDDRLGLTEALDLIASRKADGLIVRDLDRLARAVTVQEAVLATIWTDPAAEVFTATGIVPRDDPDDPMRTAFREMAAVFAGLERRMIAKRLRDGRRAKAAAGGHSIGATPYGWKSAKRSPTNPNGALMPVPAEQAALRRMAELHADGASTHQIAATLTAEGHPTKRGGRWASATVARILSRQAARG